MNAARCVAIEANAKQSGKGTLWGCSSQKARTKVFALATKGDRS
jgi:hypothetical protein